MVNARDAMPDGGSLSITTSTRTLEDSHPCVLAGELPVGSYARLSISDTGTGMTPETVARAIEPFFTTKPRGKGTGLGLAMVYGFVKQSGGAMRIYSEVGFGTNIALYLPFAEQPLPTALEPPPPPVTTTSGAKVLVVDDEEGLLEIAATYLVEAGFHTIQATNANQAIQLLLDQPDILLLITDVILGDDINGVALVQMARQISPGIRCIYCSGFPAEALADGKVSLHEGPLLNKPYHRDEFNAAVQKAMGRP
jgi:CheY-like chemotaxis protein